MSWEVEECFVCFLILSRSVDLLLELRKELCIRLCLFGLLSLYL